MEDKRQEITDEAFEQMLSESVNRLHEKEMSEPHNFSERHKRNMAKLFRKKDSGIFYQPLKIAAALILVLTIVFSALMFNDDVRAAVLERFEWLNRFFVVDFYGVDDEYARLAVWRPTYSPYGFNVLIYDYHFDEYISGAVIVYVDNEYGYADPHGRTIFWNKLWIHHEYAPFEGIAAFRENVDYSVMEIGGIAYHVFISHTNYIMCRVVWEYGGFAFNIEGMNVDMDLLLKIAQSTDVIQGRE